MVRGLVLGNFLAAITVGATDDMGTPWLLDDAMANFSAYGTTENGYAKPDLVAPGHRLVGRSASSSSPRADSTSAICP